MTSTNTISTTKTTSRISARLALAAALAATALAFTAQNASAAETFGSKLTGNTQPSNSLPAHTCPNADAQCTWIQREGYHVGGTNPDESPVDGVIKKIKVIAGGEGTFRPLLARVKEGGPLGYKSKLTYRGSKLSYEGQDPGMDPEDPYSIEKYDVHIPVNEGDHLGIEAKKTSMVRCSSGGPNTLMYQPTLALGGPFASPHDTDGCWLLIEAKVKPA